jgi:predicted RNase H-like nuclease (RuvC/YqgF family)
MFKKSNVRKLIVGVDPGLNCGLAVLTFDGAPVLIESQRGWSLTKIIERIVSLGEPTIISSDVSPAPNFLERLSKKLNAVLFEPAISMSVEEKHQLAHAYMERYNVKVKNAHEIDALAAALKAYQHYKNKFEQIDAKLKNFEGDLSLDDVKDLVVRGYSVARAIKILRGLSTHGTLTAVKGSFSREEKLRNLVKELEERLMLERERVRLLKERNRELHLKIKTLTAEIEKLKETLRKARSEQTAQIRREREYQRLIEEIDSLKKEISERESQIEAYRQELAHFQRLSDLEFKEGLTLLKPIESFTKDGLEKSFKLYNIKAGDNVFILDSSGGGPATAELLLRRGVKTVIAKGAMSHQALEVFENYNVPVIPADKINIRWIEGLPYADPEEIKKSIREEKIMKASDKLEILKTILEDHLKELSDEKTKKQ